MCLNISIFNKNVHLMLKLYLQQSIFILINIHQENICLFSIYLSKTFLKISGTLDAML